MKNITIISMLICILPAATVSAQDKPINFGVKAGIGFVTFAGKDESGVPDGVTSLELHAGILADKQVSEKISIGTELTFSYSYLSALELPLRIKYHGLGQFNLFAGPRLDFQVSSAYPI